MKFIIAAAAIFATVHAEEADADADADADAGPIMSNIVETKFTNDGKDYGNHKYYTQTDGAKNYLFQHCVPMDEGNKEFDFDGKEI